MSSQIPYLDGNAAAGELSKVFAVDITAAQAQCGSCGATQRFAEARVYMIEHWKPQHKMTRTRAVGLDLRRIPSE